MDIQAAATAARPSATGWARWHCPMCLEITGKTDTKLSWSINLTSGYWQCFKCDAKGWLDEKDRPEPAEFAPFAGPADTALPPEMILLASSEGRQSLVLAQARRYLLVTRKLTWDQIRIARLGACVSGFYAGRIIFPVSRRKEPLGFVARAWEKVDRAYVNPRGFSRDSFFNGDALDAPTDNPLFIVEGVFDALRVGPDAIACLGKPTNAQLAQLKHVHRPVVFALDGDAWKVAMAASSKLALRGQRAVYLRLPPGKDPDTLSSEWIHEKARERLTGYAGAGTESEQGSWTSNHFESRTAS